jgi:hypothetical protein
MVGLFILISKILINCTICLDMLVIGAYDITFLNNIFTILFWEYLLITMHGWMDGLIRYVCCTYVRTYACTHVCMYVRIVCLFHFSFHFSHIYRRVVS